MGKAPSFFSSGSARRIPVLCETFQPSVNLLPKKTLLDSVLHASVIMAASRSDDTGFFALQFRGRGELLAEEFEVAARATAAIRTQQPHPIEKDQQRKNIGVSDSRSSGKGGRARSLGALPLRFGQECGERCVKCSGQWSVWRFFVIDA